MNETFRNMGLRTKAIHAGQSPDPATGATAPNLVMSNSFVVDPDTPFSARMLGDDAPHFYTRWSNPTVTQLEETLAALESAESGVCFASGMAAISGLYLHLLSAGDHLLVSDVAYAGGIEFVEDTLPRLGIEVTRADLSDLSNIRQSLRPTTKLVFAETPSNPLLRLTDIHGLAEIVHSAGAMLAVDSTLATPMVTRPLELGADFVIHSLSKYLGGHGDAIGGVVLGKKKSLQALRKDTGIHLGGILSPFNAWLILRGLATLSMRMEAHSAGAIRLARSLEANPFVRRVIYPGLSSHPQFVLAAQQMTLPSGMLTFQVKGDASVARQLSRFVKVFHNAVSLGHQRSLIWYLPTEALMRSSFRLTEAQELAYRVYAGEGVFRVSVGLEDPSDLCDDLNNALFQCFRDPH